MAAKLQENSRRPFKAGESAPAYALRVGGVRMTSKLYTAEITYSPPEGGASEMSLTLDAPLSGFQNAAVKAKLGYGEDLIDWFAGRLQEPEDDHHGEGSSATAWGPSKLLSEQSFGEQTDYRGYDLGAAILDITRRAGMPAGSVELRGGGSFVLSGESAIVPLESSFGETLDSFLQSANYVGTDVPGGRTGRRLYMPRPRPGATGKYRAEFDEGHYPPGGFTARRPRHGFYSAVVVFRKGEGGSTDPLRGGVYARVPVEVEGRHKPPPGRIYYIPDFAGDQADAEREAVSTSRLLTRGLAECALEGLSPNPTLLPYDSVSVVTTELRDEGGRTKERYRVRYALILDGQLSASVSREVRSMSLGGKGLVIGERKLAKSFYVPGGSSYVVRS
jgi:hypothetical protein